MRKTTYRHLVLTLLLFCSSLLFSGELRFVDISAFLKFPVVQLLNDYKIPVQAYLSDYGAETMRTTPKRALGWYGPVKTVIQESAEVQRKFGVDTEISRITELTVRFNEYGEMIEERIYVPFGLDLLQIDRSFIKKPLEEPLDLPDGVHCFIVRRETNVYGQVTAERMIDWNGDVVYEIKSVFSQNGALLQKAIHSHEGFVSARTFSYDDTGLRLLSIRESDRIGTTTYEIQLGYAENGDNESYLQSEKRINGIGNVEYIRITDSGGRLLEEVVNDRYGRLYTKKTFQYEHGKLVLSEAYTAEGLYNRQKWVYLSGLLMERVSNDAQRMLERETYEYDSAGRLVEQSRYGISGVFLWKRVFRPSAAIPLEITQYTSQGDVFSKEIFTYDTKGRMISDKVYASYLDKGIRVYFVESHETWEYIENPTKKYVEKTIESQMLFDRSKKISDLVVERQFDDRKNVIEEKTKISGKEVDYYKRKFDESNRMIEEEVKNSKDNYKRKLSYYASGQVKEIIYLDGNKRSRVFVYDEGNNLITEERYDANENLTYKIEYERLFDAWGNWIKVIQYAWEKEPWDDLLQKKPQLVVYRSFEYYE